MSLRVALIGYGTGGAVFHAPLISSVPGFSLSAVVTSDPERSEAVRTRYPGTEVVDRADRIWQTAESYDLVVVTTPNRLHVPLTHSALEAGLPVVVDKPVAATAEDARQLGVLAAERGLLVVPFHNRRWDGDFRTVRRLIDEGALGAVHGFESRFERWRPRIKPGWKENTDPAEAGGILYDLGSHLIDQALTLYGRPLTVYAELDVRRHGAAVPDDAFVALTHPGGERSHLWMSAMSPQPGPRFRVLADTAGYVSYGMDGQEDALRAGRTPREEGWGLTAPESYGQVGTPEAARPVATEPGAYQEFYAGVGRALRGEAPPPVALADAVTGLEVIEAAIRSSQDRAVVTLPEPRTRPMA
jgi:predicted dehydrogenase